MNNFAIRYEAPRMTAGDTAEMKLYGEIIAGMPQEWKWDQEDKSAADFDRELEALKSSGARNLLIRMNCPGGYVNQGVAMRSALVQAGFEKVTVRIEGMCASAATLIATVPGARVEIAPGSEYMIHNPWNIVIGTAGDLEAGAARLRKEEDSFREMYVKRTGRAEEEIKAWMDAETWFNAREAVKAGFCDEVLEEDEDDRMQAGYSPEITDLMRERYAHLPAALADPARRETHMNSPETEAHAPAAAENIQKEENRMEMNELTAEALREGNPALADSMMQAGAEAERQRVQDIYDLTPAGCEAMAKEAVANGTSAMDYMKALAKAQREKGDAFLSARRAETQAAAQVKGGASADNDKAEDADESAKAVAKYAERMKANHDTMY